MKNEARNKYFKINDSILESNEDDIFEQIITPSIYEVIRVIDGVPIFLEEHLDRMFTSARIINYDMLYSKDQIKESIKEVILKNKVHNQNIKLLGSKIDDKMVFLVYFVDSFYPPKEYYSSGIKTIIFEHERDNPNAKIQKDDFRKKVKEAMDMNDAFEALLINNDGYILEGSRSNMFFVKDNKIFTAPSNQVLLGITRKYIFNIAEILNIDIVEEAIHMDDIKDLQGAFMSGTSVGVLPISRIDTRVIQSTDNEIIKRLNKAYDELIENYIREEKTQWK